MWKRLKSPWFRNRNLRVNRPAKRWMCRIPQRALPAPSRFRALAACAFPLALALTLWASCSSKAPSASSAGTSSSSPDATADDPQRRKRKSAGDKVPVYGYEIVKGLAQAPKLAASEGTVYPLLRWLRKVGWLETYWQESDAGPPRQYYRLSPGGGEYLAALRKEWNELIASVGVLVDREREK